MSHFTVLVVGDNPEEQLAPFQENNMGDCPKEYLQFFDTTDENLEDYKQNPQGYESFESYMAEYCEIKKDPQMQQYGYWENPNRKWDWYQLGGRWKNFFLLKNGTHADQARKADIDFEAMSALRKEEAILAYTEYTRKIAIGERVHPWFEYGIKEMDGQLEQLNDYVERESAVTTFAVIREGQWYEKGSMGWWGCVGDRKDPKEWEAMFKLMLQDLAPTTLLSVYDCHI